jgi:hypothetical protein
MICALGAMGPALLVGKGLCGYQSMVHMRTVNSMAIRQHGGSGMEHLREYHAAADMKRRGNSLGRRASALTFVRRLALAVATLLVASVLGTASHAQSSGPFAGMAGNWTGAGTVTLDDGSTERIRCRATYAVGAGGNGLQQTLTCASDSYKFNLTSNITAQGSAVSGTWSETSRNINGSIEGRSGGGVFQVIATAPGFSANLTLTTRGNKQSVVIRAESQFKGASISLSRS